MKRAAGDPLEVSAAAAAMAARGAVQYWVVVSYRDGLELVRGRVPAALRAQVLTLLKRGRAESPAEYAARVGEG